MVTYACLKIRGYSVNLKSIYARVIAMVEEIKKNKIVELKIDDLKFDKDNPNKMSSDGMEGLIHSLKKYGDLHPIAVDQNMLIADGEHRVLAYKAVGKKTIKGYIVELTELERRELRQAMNKNRGTHDPQKDAKEIEWIFKKKGLEELSILIATPQEELTAMIEMFSKEQENKATLDQATTQNSATSAEITSTENNEITGALPTANTCPKCGYKW